MTAMLEKAARAAQKTAVMYGREMPAGFSAEIARAVLMAVKKLPEDFTRERRAQFYNTEFLDADFESVIDAILAQEPGA